MEYWINWVYEPQAWVALGTLTLLEIVLGIDNVVFISILSGRLPEEQQTRARTVGLGLAMGGRILLLLSLGWIMGLEAPLFTVFSQEISGRDLILLIGGLFLLTKATHEIHDKLEGEEDEAEVEAKRPSFKKVLIQILVLDLVFSLDSVITAVGMAKYVPVMILAVVLAVGVMMVTAAKVSSFIERHPTVKMLALSFLLLIGLSLVAEGLAFHIPKGYVYFAMTFSMLVEMLNLRLHAKDKKKSEPVDLRNTRWYPPIGKDSE